MLPPGGDSMAQPYSPSDKAQTINTCFREKISTLFPSPIEKKKLKKKKALLKPIKT